ncbi:MAG: ATP-binding protein [Tenuifilaceae bacterium]
MFERQELRVLKERIQEPRRFIQVLMGPRQVGKTTLVGQLTKQINIPFIFESADAVPAGGSNWLQQVWEAARLKMQVQSANEFLLIVDEVQKISNWSEIVKKLWDEDSKKGIPLKVILLGSSRLLIQQGLTESLAGRFETIYLTHWTFNEMEKAFGWDANTFAWFGGYPGGAELIKDESRWKRYVRDSLIETSLSKDIIMLTRIDKPALMKNLFELGCLYSGQILSYTKMQGQLQDAGNTTTLSHYLNLLDTAGLLGGIEKFAANTIRKRSSSPKFQVHNNALLSAQKGDQLAGIMSKPNEWGRVVESSIGAHLLNQSVRSNFSVFYWRERNDEVDFVLEREGKVIALEVKSSYTTNKKGMEAFNRRFNPSKMYYIDNSSLPWGEFLKIDPLELF